MSLYFVFVSQFTCLSAKTTGIDPACRKLSGDFLDVHAVWRCKSADLAYFGLKLGCFEPHLAYFESDLAYFGPELAYFKPELAKLESYLACFEFLWSLAQ